MSGAADIKDQNSLKAWLETQPNQVSVLIAARAACRGFPLINSYQEDDPPLSAIIWPTLWAMGTALFAGDWPNRAVMSRAAAAFAADAADAAADAAAAAFAAAAADAAAAAAAAFAADAAAAAAADAADAADAVDAASRAVFAIIRQEAETIDGLPKDTRAQALYDRLLWPKSDDENIQKWENLTRTEWTQLRARLSADDANMSAAITWYERLLNHGPTHKADYEITRFETFDTHYDEDAKDKGAAKINAALIEIEDRFFPSKVSAIQDIANQTPLAETMSLNEDLGVYDVEFVPVIDLYDKNLSRIADSLASVISSNAFNENSPEVKFLEDMMDNHRSDPQRLHDDCKYAHDHIQNLINKEVIADDFAVGTLLNALHQTMFDIVANDADVKKAVDARVTLNMNERAHVSDATRLTNAVEQIANILSDGLKQDTRSDTQILIAGDSARLNAAYRLLSRNSRIFLDINAREGVKAASVHSQPHLDKLVEQLPNIERILELIKPYLG